MKQLWKTHEQGFRLLRMMHRINRSAIPVYMLYAALSAVQPFIGIGFSARIVDALLATRWRMALILAALMLGAQLALGLLLDALDEKKEVISMAINRQSNAMICLKTIALDYATFADRKNLEQFQEADAIMQRKGGFGWVLIYYGDLLQQLLTAAVSCGFLVQFCLCTAQGHAGLTGELLTAPGSFAAICAMLAALTACYQRAIARVNRNLYAMVQEEAQIEASYLYFDQEIQYGVPMAKDIRLYRMADMLEQQSDRINAEGMRHYRRVYAQEQALGHASALFGDVMMLCTYLLVALKAFAGAITVGGLTRSAGAVHQFHQAVQKAIEANGKIALAVQYLSFYIEYQQKKNLLDTGSLPVEKRLDNVYEFEFHDVGFQYPGTDVWALRHVSAKLDLKQKFAVVGMNGAGKTTFIKLLCRLYDVTEGCITLNGIDIRKYDYDEYLSLFAAVFQDFSLFAFPVGENVACEAHLDEARVWDALERAGARQRVEKMSHGLNTPLDPVQQGGEDVSGGEAQKIAIARALYKDAPFVILDEPTAALDPISEYEVYSRFDQMVQDKTSIYISHRMSSCRFCGDILVFDGGRLVQRGDHDSLIADESGVYARLWHAQAKYYEEERALSALNFPT